MVCTHEFLAGVHALIEVRASVRTRVCAMHLNLRACMHGFSCEKVRVHQCVRVCANLCFIHVTCQDSFELILQKMANVSALDTKQSDHRQDESSRKMILVEWDLLKKDTSQSHTSTGMFKGES